MLAPDPLPLDSDVDHPVAVLVADECVVPSEWFQPRERLMPMVLPLLIPSEVVSERLSPTTTRLDSTGSNSRCVISVLNGIGVELVDEKLLRKGLELFDLDSSEQHLRPGAIHDGTQQLPALVFLE